MRSLLLLLTLVASLVAGIPQSRQAAAAPKAQAASGRPDCLEDGLYEDFEQCDLYWQCSSGVATPHLCDDGLVFDIFKANAGHVDPCDTPLVVDCTHRPLLQEPTFPSEFCMRKHGIFADPDPSNCNRFHTCKDGFKESSTDCSPGLRFDIRSSICTWPDASGRSGCVEKPTSCVKSGNFCCPDEQIHNADGLVVPHPAFLDPEDCQRFYVCLNGKTPQESSCPLGQVFNDRTSLCDFPGNVPECIGWFRDHPDLQYYYDDLADQSDVGAQDIV